MDKEKYSSETHQILQLSARLFHHSVLAAQNDTHTTKVPNFGRAYDERIDVETPCSQNSRDARKDTRLILHETVEDMSISNESSSALEEKKMYALLVRL